MQIECAQAEVLREAVFVEEVEETEMGIWSPEETLGRARGSRELPAHLERRCRTRKEQGNRGSLSLEGQWRITQGGKRKEWTQGPDVSAQGKEFQEMGDEEMAGWRIAAPLGQGEGQSPCMVL